MVERGEELICPLKNVLDACIAALRGDEERTYASPEMKSVIMCIMCALPRKDANKCGTRSLYPQLFQTSSQRSTDSMFAFVKKCELCILCF